MKEKESKNEGYYAVSALLSLILIIVIHYFTLKTFFIAYPTLHVIISLLGYIILSSFLSYVLSKFWN